MGLKEGGEIGINVSTTTTEHMYVYAPPTHTQIDPHHSLISVDVDAVKLAVLATSSRGIRQKPAAEGRGGGYNADKTIIIGGRISNVYN